MRVIQLIFFVAIIAMSVSLSAIAQVRKCTGADGKVTYSDFVCANTSSEGNVRINANTIDGSDLRRQAGQIKNESAIAEAMQKSSGQCKFSYFAYGDSKGKLLAAAAKEECLQNIAAKATGQPTSLDAYEMWKDHSTQKNASRQSAVNAANAQAAATANQNAINQLGNQLNNKSYNCKPNLLGTALECK